MNRHFCLFLHRTGAIISLATISCFWLATSISELTGGQDCIIRVKSAIPWGFLVLIPALIMTGATGARLAGRATLPLIRAKKKRMPFIALNGILILIPCAFVLRYLARTHQFDTFFIAIQGVELIMGAINILLICFNIRDGFRLKATGTIAGQP